ncbi:MAG TPA: tyrosine-protein phosphatase [Mycobacterium sp.]|nr:tyrosine-protein phosphatase [Mycobacterium sp.]
MNDLSGGWNFRDVGDSTAGAIRPGRLFRSGELTKLDAAGVGQLRDIGLTDVADLRSPREVERHGGDLVPDGVAVHLLPFLDIVAVVDGDAPHEHAFQRLLTEKPDDESVLDAGRRYMIEEYVRFARAPGARHAVQRMVTLLGDGGAVLTHCFAGKDRTGFGVAVLLQAAGVDHDTIMADYLYSNNAIPALRAQIMEMVASRFDDGIPPEAAEFTEARLSDEVLGVRPEYLEVALETVTADHGSVEGYLRAAEVTPEDIDKLRVALLE